MSREVCGVCWCPYDAETGECACAPPEYAMAVDELRATLMTQSQIEIHAAIPEHVSVRYRTTGPRGGDAGHGGHTKLVLSFEGGAYTVSVKDRNNKALDFEGPQEVTLTVRGDWEMEGLDHALRSLGVSLVQQRIEREYT